MLNTNFRHEKDMASEVNAQKKVTTDDSNEVATVISVPQAASLLGVHKNTIYKYIDEGELPAFRLVQGGRWKIKKDEFEEWLQVKQARAQR